MGTRRQLLWAVGAAAVAGCARPLARPPALPRARRLRRDAHQVATELCLGRVGALYRLEGMGDFNAPDIVLTLDGMPQLFERCDLDPRHDIVRAFGVGPDTFTSDGISVLEHRLGAERLTDAFARMRGRPVAHFGFPAARTRLAGIERTVAAPEPHLLVIGPTALEADFRRFRGRGLPEPRDGATAFWFSEQPSLSVDDGFFPATLKRAELTTTINRQGGGQVRFVAFSTDAAQAERDAEALTKRALDATSVDIGIFRLSLFEQRVLFRAERAAVIAETALTADEVRWIVAVMVRGIPV